MSYVLQQKHHTYINNDVNRLANVCLDNSAYKRSFWFQHLWWPQFSGKLGDSFISFPFWSPWRGASRRPKTRHSLHATPTACSSQSSPAWQLPCVTNRQTPGTFRYYKFFSIFSPLNLNQILMQTQKKFCSKLQFHQIHGDLSTNPTAFSQS